MLQIIIGDRLAVAAAVRPGDARPMAFALLYLGLLLTEGL